MKFVAFIAVFISPLAICFWAFPRIVFNSAHQDLSNLIPGFLVSFFSVFFLGKMNAKKSLSESFWLTVMLQILAIFLVVIFLKSLPRV